jgi:hypothetical protein
MNIWILSASAQEPCEYLKERFRGASPIRMADENDRDRLPFVALVEGRLSTVQQHQMEHP